MTEAKPNQVESKPDAKVASPIASDTTHDARATLSTSIQDMMKEAVSGATKSPSDNSSPQESASTFGEAIGKAANKTGPGDQAGSATGKIAEDMIKNGVSGIGGKITEGMLQNGEANKHTEKSGALENLLKGGVGISDLSHKVTDQDRKEAKAALEKGISSLVPEADRKLQVALQNAIIDGDMGKFQEAVKALGNDPEKLAKMVKEVNDQLDKNENFGGVELSMDSKGNVLLYGEKGNTAVSVNPKTGDSTLRAVEKQADGSVVLKDGEIINRTPAEVMKNLGDEATRSITELPFRKLMPMDHNRKPTLPDRDPYRSPGWPQPRGGGGGEKPNLKEKLHNNGHLDFTPLKGLDKESNDK
jgi:hypothetical protein